MPERLVAALVLLGIGLFILWGIAIRPAMRTLQAAPTQLDALDAQYQHMQRLALEANELRSVSPVQSAEASLALTSATERLGDKGQINIQSGRATLTLNGVSGERLRAWLTEARTGARARPIEMILTRGPQGYSGNVVVTLGGTP